MQTQEQVAPVEMTAEQIADVQKQADPVDTKMSDAILSDVAFAADLKSVRQQGERDKRYGTRSKFHTAAIVANRVKLNCEAHAKTWEARENIRSQTIRLFAFEYAAGAGMETSEKAKYPEKVMAEIFRGFHFRSILDEATRESLMNVSWDAITGLLRWLQYDEREDEWSLSFKVDIGIKDADNKTSRTIDAGPILETLIPALVASPKSKTSLRKIMDEREEQARKAEIAFLGKREMKQAVAAKDLADRARASEEKTALFDRFVRSLVAAKLGTEDVFTELSRRNLLPAPKDDDNTPDVGTLAANATADEATMIGKLWVQHNNIDAIAALYETIKSLVAESTQTGPVRSASVTVDALGSTRILKSA